MNSPFVPILKTDRMDLIHLSLVEPQTLLDFQRRNDEHLKATNPTWIPEDTLESCAQRIKNSTEELKDESAIRFCCFLKDEKMVGTLSFSQIFRKSFQACYMGYIIDHEHQGQGLMTEAICEGIRYMIEDKNIHRIMANYLPENKASARVLEKLGFIIEGTAIDYLHINGKWRDHVLTSLTNQNWAPPS